MDENDETCVNIWVAIEEKLDSSEIEFQRKRVKSSSDALKDEKEKLRKAYNSGLENFAKVAMKIFEDDQVAQKKLDDGHDECCDTRGTIAGQYSVNSSEVGNERKDTISLLDKLTEKWKELYDLYDEYEPISKTNRELFKKTVMSDSSDGKKVVSHSSDGEYQYEYYGEEYDDIKSLKIETWYFLTITEATRHILFDQFLELCLFIKNNESSALNNEHLKKLFLLPDELILYGIKNGKCFALDIEHLKKLFPLPDELILNGIKRKINQHKILERERKFTIVMKHIAKNDYFERSPVSRVLPRLKEDMKFHDISDDILEDWIDFYSMYLIRLPYMHSADCRKCFEHIIMQEIDTHYVIRCKDIKENWEICKNDGLPYYNAFMNLQQKYGKIEISYFLTKQEKNLLLEFEEHIKSSPDYYNCSAEAIQSLKQRFPLPKDLIVNGIKRSINLFKRAEILQKFSDLLNFLLSNDYILLNFSISELLQLLKKESNFYDLDDNILKEALGVYLALFSSPDKQSADFRKQNEDLLKSSIDRYYKKKCFGMETEWESEKKYLYYGTSKFPYMEVHSSFELPYRAPIKLGNMERKELLKCIRWDQDKPITWKHQKTIEDGLDNQDVDEILSDLDVIEEEIIRITSMILEKYFTHWCQYKKMNKC